MKHMIYKGLKYITDKCENRKYSLHNFIFKFAARYYCDIIILVP